MTYMVDEEEKIYITCHGPAIPSRLVRLINIISFGTESAIPLIPESPKKPDDKENSPGGGFFLVLNPPSITHVGDSNVLLSSEYKVDGRENDTSNFAVARDMIRLSMY